MKKILSIAVCAFLFASCTVYQYTGRDAAINLKNIQATPTIVDVKADFTRRVSATSDWQLTKEDAMAQARYIAITENNIDIVVDPIYEIQFRPHPAATAAPASDPTETSKPAATKTVKLKSKAKNKSKK